MKTFNSVSLSLALAATGICAQTANSGQATGVNLTPPTPYQIVSSGPNFNVWQWQTFEPLPNGQVGAHTHSYTELASGLNYQDQSNGQWVPAQELIQPYSQGAIAQLGQARVIYANNLNTAGAVDEETPDGNRLVSNILGLMYDNPVTGQTAQIAEIQDSQGQLITANQVLYTNAFKGVNASVRFTYRRDGTEQDVILEAQPPAPEVFGLRSDTAELVVVTEFLSPPDASVFEKGTDPEGIETDESISWGATSLGHGKAFSIGGTEIPVRVFKQYLNINGRYLLFEKVKYRDVQPSLAKLPLQASNAKRLPGMASTHFRFPKGPAAKSAARPMRLALGELPEKGYVLDFTTLGTAYTNFVFQGDTTYFVSGQLNLSGTNNVFEGGTVIKYATNTLIAGVSGGQFSFLSQPYHPAIFTAKDDNTVGEVISNSTGNPVGYYANSALSPDYSPASAWSNFRVSYAVQAIGPYSTPLTITDAQFVKCQTGAAVLYGNLAVNNALFLGVPNAFFTLSSSVTANNASFVNITNMMTGPSGSTLSLTNCVLVDVTNVMGATGSTNGLYQTPGFGSGCVTNLFYPFKQVGAANCYLTNGCAFFQGGTPAVGSNVLALLANRTTHPPVVYYTPGIYFSSNLTLYPQAPRDTNSSPDLGYHYYPLDFIFGPTYITNATITANPGTAIGIFASNVFTYGISPANNGQFISQGLANNLNHIVEYNTVQEQTPNGWLPPSYGMVANFNGTNFLINCRFTDWSSLAQDACHLQMGQSAPLGLRDCQFHGGSIQSGTTSINLTNCLLERVYLQVVPADSSISSYRNNTFWNGTFLFAPWQTNSLIVDNLFDGTAIPDYLGGLGVTYIGGHNAYVTNCNTLDPTQAGDLILANSPTYQTSWLGNYYLPPNSPLINAGSTTADQVGLYHFTTQTNQVPETNSTVDIGYHYVATDQYGNPLDSNGNGIPDYLEDTCGCGQPLTITLLSPTNNTFYAEPANISLQASVFDWRSVVTNVSFLNGSSSIVAVTNAPFQTTWPIVPAGVYSVSATGYDLTGATTNSASASVTVTNLCGSD